MPQKIKVKKIFWSSMVINKFILWLRLIWTDTLQALSSNIVGRISVKEATGEDVRRMQECDQLPVREGCLRGTLSHLYEKQAYFKPYGEEAIYYTHQAYAMWAGAVVEAEIEIDESCEILEQKGIGNFPVKGWAYRVFIRNTSSGILFDLPEPDEIPESKPGDCQCPFCLGAKAVDGGALN
jgi:hypothetical protein